MRKDLDNIINRVVTNCVNLEVNMGNRILKKHMKKVKVSEEDMERICGESIADIMHCIDVSGASKEDIETLLFATTSLICALLFDTEPTT